MLGLIYGWKHTGATLIMMILARAATASLSALTLPNQKVHTEDNDEVLDT